MTTYVGTSWKMTKTVDEAREFARRLNAAPAWPEDVQPFVVPPHTALDPFREELDPRTGVLVGAQTAHWAPEGAFTGEVSMGMIKDAGATLVEIGHSERREHFNETDTTVGLKVASALAAGLTPLVCIGEDLETRRHGGAADHLHAQVVSALGQVPPSQTDRVLLAYEPVWSIGEEGSPAEAEQVAEVVTTLRRDFAVMGFLYGGSVSADNAADYLAVPGVDGLFVGRAAWRAEDFLGLVALAGRIGVRREGAAS